MCEEGGGRRGGPVYPRVGGSLPHPNTHPNLSNHTGEVRREGSENLPSDPQERDDGAGPSSGISDGHEERRQFADFPPDARSFSANPRG